MGYQNPSDGAMGGLTKDYKGLLNQVTIEHLEGMQGSIVESWTLYGAFITSLSTSKLDYSNDDLSEITIEISYDYATLVTSAENESRLERLKAKYPQLPTGGTITL